MSSLTRTAGIMSSFWVRLASKLEGWKTHDGNKGFLRLGNENDPDVILKIDAIAEIIAVPRGIRVFDETIMDAINRFIMLVCKPNHEMFGKLLIWLFEQTENCQSVRFIGKDGDEVCNKWPMFLDGNCHIRTFLYDLKNLLGDSISLDVQNGGFSEGSTLYDPQLRIIEIVIGAKANADIKLISPDLQEIMEIDFDLIMQKV